jgi:pimeloyl-ACP methyl ester carboxylesterase
VPDVTVNGVTIAYLRAGSGPPLVCLHGIGSSARSWGFQLQDLSDELSVIAWDTPGYGGSSDPPADELSMRDYANYLVGFLDALDLPRVHLMGLSWGGILALECYARAPERVRSLVLADTLLGYGMVPAEERERLLRERLAPLEQLGPAGMAEQRAPRLLTADAPAELLAEVRSIMAQVHPAGYRLAAIAMGNADVSAVLPRVAVPTLLLWGQHDQVTPLDTAEVFKQAIPGARFIMIPRAGHVSNQEQPELYNAIVRGFLRQVS